MAVHRLIVGLDYGTTYTGVSFCETSADENNPLGAHIEIIHDWPSCHNKVGTKEKVPSEVAYTNGGLRWGSDIPVEIARFIWTKLELDPDYKTQDPKIKRRLFGASPPSGKEPIEIIADFLMQVKTHMIKNLNDRYGEDLWKSMPITLVMTVPLSDRTLQAVKKAGLDSLQFPQLERTMITTEPECAAIYTINSLRGSARDKQFKVGDGFIVCDMGGGTVDLISYKVAGLKPTTVNEATVGSGSQCGGSFVDRAFLQWLERRLGTEDFKKIAGCRSEQIPRTSLSTKVAKMLQDFTMEAKCSFSGEEEYYLRLPGRLGTIVEDGERGILDGEIVISPDDMREMFNFSLAETFELLTAQKHQAESNGVKIKYVFLVGGFSTSPYMQNRIRKFTKKLKLQVITPLFPWSAVVRGAVIAGLEGGGQAVQYRKCRRNYGTDCDSLFDIDDHVESESFICSFTGEKRARGQMDWLAKKGDDLATINIAHAERGFYWDLWSNASKVMSIDLYASNGEAAPQRLSDAGIMKLATLRVDLRDIPDTQWEPHTSPSGKPYHRIDFNLEISIQSSLEFSCVIDGKKYGSITATYH